MNKELKTNPEFQNLIAPLSGDEFEQLEQNILTHGKCRDAIKVWRDYIIDGHNRYAICQKHGLSYGVQKIRLANKNAAKLWIAENQLGRRNLTKAMRIELARLKVDMMRGTTKENSKPFVARTAIAQAAGVSENTVHKYVTLAGSGCAKLIEQVRKGEITIGAAHKKLQMATREVEVLYDDSDPQYFGTQMCCVNMLGRANGLGQFYDVLEDAGDFSDAAGVVPGLRGQLDAVVGFQKR